MQIVKCMSEDCGVQLTQLKVDGGMTANDLFVQMQSDLLGATVCTYQYEDILTSK